MNGELLTDRLRLVPVDQTDFEFIFSLLRHDKIKKYLCDNRDIENEFVKRLIKRNTSLFEEKGIGLWVIKLTTASSAVGFCGFIKDRLIELIYVVHPDFQNDGYATESILKVLEYFHQLKLPDEIFAKIDNPNLASHVVASKIGMIEVGEEINPVTDGIMKVYKLIL
jgi:ribosomal-protein-alanine N-acetyltransferase